MIVAHCSACNKAYRVIGRPDDLHSLFSLPEWEVSFPCPTSLCGGRALRVPIETLPLLTPACEGVEVSAKDFYRAINGQGSAPVAAIRKLLLGGQIVDMEADSIGDPERTIIHNLTFSDGTKVHFGISRMGACAYKIEESPSVFHPSTNLEGGGTDRAQAGRAAEDVGPTNEHAPGCRYAPANRCAARPDEPAGSGTVPSVSTATDVQDRGRSGIDQ